MGKAGIYVIGFMYVIISSFVTQDVLRDTADHDIGHAVAHFFNCLFGDCQSASGKGVSNNAQAKNQKKVNNYSNILKIHSSVVRTIFFSFFFLYKMKGKFTNFVASPS